MTNLNTDAGILLSSPDLKNEFNHAITDELYHSDKTSVSSTNLRKMLQSPKAFYHAQFIEQKKAENEAFRFGKLAHKAILEGTKFLENYVVEPEFVGFTKDGKPSTRSAEAKAKREEWLAKQPKDAIICTQDDYDTLSGITASITEHPQAMDCLADGMPEIAGFYTDEKTNIRLRIKPDFISNDYTRIVDLKTTQSCDARRFGSSAFEYGYAFQMRMYCEGVKAITGIMPELVLIIAVEKTPPFECAVYFFTPDIFEAASVQYRMALDTLKDSIDSNKWPMRQKEIEALYVPNWALDQLNNG